MYIDSFNLQSRPFAIVPDRDFLVWTTQHKIVYQKLLQNVLTGTNVTLFTGEVGCGKSTILQALINTPEIEQRRRVILISNRLNADREVPQHILIGLDTDFEDRSTDELTALAIAKMAAQRAPPLIIIDEAQTLADDAALLLASIAQDTPQETLRCSIILTGQPELRNLVARPAMKPLSDLIDDRIKVEQLPEDEIAGYVEGRLALAGYAGGRLFEEDALGEIHAFSRGTPRLINKLCDLALFCASKQGRSSIDAAFIREVRAEWTPLGGAPITSKYADRAKPAKPRSSRKPPVSKAVPSAAPTQPDVSPKVAAIAPPATEPLTEIALPSGRHTPHEPADDKSPGPEVETLNENVIKAPLPHRPKPRLVLGGLAAAACAVPALLLLNVLDDPMQGPLTLPAPQTNNVSAPPATSSISSVTSNFAETGLAPARPRDTDPQPIVQATDTAQEVDALKEAIAAAKAEQEALEALLARQLQDLETTPSPPVSTNTMRVAETGVGHSLSQSPLKPDAAVAQPGIISTEGADKPDPATNLAGVFEQKSPPTDNTDITQVVSRSAIQLIGPESLLATAPVTPQPLTLVRMATDGEEPMRYFLAGLDSATPGDSAINYARAALRGHPRAAEYLGQLFDTGDGVALASDMAQRWYAVADDADMLLSTEVAPVSVAAAQQSVQPLTAFVTDGTAEFIWDGNASAFSLELADQDKTTIAVAASPLTALSLKLPEQAAFWRVTTDAGASFDWQSIAPPND